MKAKTDSRLATFFGKTRASRAIALSGVCLILVFALLVALNLAFEQLPMSITTPDVTGKDTFDISDKTLKLLDEIDQDVTLYFLCNGGEHSADGTLLAFLSKYEEASSRVSLKVIDTAKDTDFIAAHGGSAPSDLSVVVESDARYKLVDNLDLYYYYFYDASNGAMVLTPPEYSAMLNSIAQDDSTGELLAYFMQSTTPYFNGESAITNAINYVTLDRVASVCVLSGNGSSALDASLTEFLSGASFDLTSFASLAEIPEPCDVLLINAPTKDLSEEEATALSTYLANGGKLFLTTLFNSTDLPNLASVLNTYGLGFANGSNVLCEGNTNYLIGSSGASYPFLFYAHMDSNHPFSAELDGSFTTFYPHAITLTETEGVKLTSWLETSAVGYLLDATTGKQTEDPKATYTLGAIAEKNDTQIVWLASATSLTEQVNASSSNGNFALALSVLNQLSGVTDESISVASHEMDMATLSVSPIQLVVVGALLILLIPLTFIVIGVGVWFARKKR